MTGEQFRYRGDLDGNTDCSKVEPAGRDDRDPLDDIYATKQRVGDVKDWILSHDQQAQRGALSRSISALKAGYAAAETSGTDDYKDGEPGYDDEFRTSDGGTSGGFEKRPRRQMDGSVPQTAPQTQGSLRLAQKKRGKNPKQLRSGRYIMPASHLS